MHSTLGLKFAERPKHTAIVAAEGGGLGATIRYGFEHDVDENDTIELLDATSEQVFLYARVERVTTVPVWKALDVVRASGAVYGTMYVQKLLAVLNDYYTADIQPTDEVTVIIYEPDPTSR